MTVGELVYKQVVEQGYNPTSAKRLISPLNKGMESYQKLMRDMKEPIEKVNSMIESVTPQMENITKRLHSSLPLGGMYEEDDNSFPILMKPIHEVRIINPEDIVGSGSKREHEFFTASYLLPQNANWESLKIQFIDGHIVKVSYPNMKSQKFDYKDMGFLNAKTHNPNRKWELLRAIAENDGALTVSKWNKKFGRNVKYELNEGLKKFFGMDTSPITNYTKKNGYSPLFSIQKEK